MAFQNRLLLYTTIGLLVVTAALYIMANALPIWITASTESSTYTYGLWKVCNTVEGTKICLNAPLKTDSETMSMRAFIIICCILSPLSVVSILSILYNEDLKKKMFFWAKCLAVTTLVCGIIGVAIGINEVVKSKDRGGKMGVSCILAITALVLNLASAVTTFFLE
ncbi:unnamed protein product [Adineta steineri]|uniref:Claudin n=1 Tax=Adineta steineri TaxID=433720 RepID=A0A814Q2X5_9BILA|nr:unnamed protein product [Adineta steineri]CAF3771842.1 unnamed protein product [Adineta steineri]